MRKIVVLGLSVLFMLVLAVPAQPGSLPTSMVPQDAQWILHVDVKKFVSTQFCDLLIKSNQTHFNHVIDRISQKLKFDPLKDLYGITIFGYGSGKENAVLCLTGNLDKNYLLSLLGAEKSHQETPYGKYTIHSWHGSAYGTFANDRLVVMGKNEDAVKSVVDVIDGKKKSMTASNLMAYWKEMPEDAFLKAAASNISSLAHHHEASMILKKSGMGFFLALEKNEILKLKLKLTTDTPETAQNINNLVQGFMALLKLKQNDTESPKHMKLLKLLEDLKINIQGNVVQMEWGRPSKDLLDMLSHSHDEGSGSEHNEH